MGIFGLAKKGFGLLGKKKKPLESKTYKKLKKRERDDAIFKGVLGGGALTGYVGIRLETERKKEKQKEKAIMDMIRLLKSVRASEGYRNMVYLDTLGKRTVGVGHLCVEDFWEDNKEYEEDFLMEILEKDLENAISGAEELLQGCEVDDLCRELIVEMVFQMGKTGVSKFPAMWRALKSKPPQYKTASIEMLDSRWAKQTPNRAKSMAKKMKSLE